MKACTEVDGALFEGGGQLLRVAVGLSILTQQPVRISNIRGGRLKPGLAPSHLTAIQLLADISHAQVEGLALGSCELVFRPGVPQPGHYVGDCGTAGSITLMCQAILPVLARLSASSVVELRGGTDVPFTPSTHFMQTVLQPTLARMGVLFEYDVLNFGFVPRGGGIVRLTVHPASVLPLQLFEKDSEPRFKALICFSPTQTHTVQQMKNQEYIEQVAKAVEEILGISRGKVKMQQVEASGKTLVLNVWARCGPLVTLHHSRLETFMKKAKVLAPNKLADETCQVLLEQTQSPACADDHLQDQLLFFAALASGPSVYAIQRLTSHTEGIIDLVHKFGIATVQIEDSYITVSPMISTE